MDGCHLSIGIGFGPVLTKDSMISSIYFSNFKCLHDKEFKFGNINVFTGYNGRGKSSVIQSFLLLSQSVRKDEITSLEKLHLNGDFVRLGDFDELLTDDKKELFSFTIGITEDTLDKPKHNVILEYKLEEDWKIGKLNRCLVDETDMFDSNKSFDSEENDHSQKQTLKQLPLFLYKQFYKQYVHYISADRKGPVKFVEKQETPDFYTVGSNGEYTINTIYSYKNMVDINMNLREEDTEPRNLLTSVSEWIDFIMNGGAVKIEDDDKKKRQPVLSLNFGFKGNRTFQSYNVGFGYSYILSIVVTALIAKTGDIVIIENPEAHLHPLAQKNIAFLLSKLSARGVQVFIETHSEHVVNGFRIAALKPEYKLEHDQVQLFFFNEDYNIECLHIEPNGRIKNWPKGFFDQYQLEMSEIIKLGSNKA